jgi:hypothetical protein
MISLALRGTPALSATVSRKNGPHCHRQSVRSRRPIAVASAVRVVLPEDFFIGSSKQESRRARCFRRDCCMHADISF